MSNKKRISRKVNKLYKRPEINVYYDLGSHLGSSSIRMKLIKDTLNDCWTLLGEYWEIIEKNKISKLEKERYYYQIKSMTPNEDWYKLSEILSKLPYEYKDDFSRMVMYGFNLEGALETLKETYKF